MYAFQQSERIYACSTGKYHASSMFLSNRTNYQCLPKHLKIQNTTMVHRQVASGYYQGDDCNQPDVGCIKHSSPELRAISTVFLLEQKTLPQ